VSEPAAASPAFSAGRAIFGVVLGLAGHVLAFVAGFVAARVTSPSAGGGFDDIAAAVGALLLGEIVTGLVCLVGGAILFVRGRRDLGLGLAGGWVVGAIATWAFLFAR
jgi:hypothetical protein